ncbi:MAG: amino acid ABC transporter substrate-binding protein, partial [Anaerolineae bacterium]|nr:amino acid ABC transporter substrate-binding protein [Anaerolineae bacterium]
RSLLEIRRFSTDNPFSYIVWNQPFTRVVIAPVYRYGDQQWANIGNWTLWGLIQAETLGITSKNVSEFIRLSDEPDESYLGRVGLPVAQLLDAKLGLGGQLGLPNDFMYTVIEQVGNYGEIYERALGSTSALPIERQLNQLVTAGGLIAAPDWR